LPCVNLRETGTYHCVFVTSFLRLYLIVNVLQTVSRTLLTQASFSLPVELVQPGIQVAARSSPASESEVSQGLLSLSYFTTLTNGFGLSKRFYGFQFPVCSPDGRLTLRDFADTPTDDDEAQLFISSHSQTTTTSFSPYPNLSSFLLGEWFWDNGIQKSQKDFKDLMDILCHPDFELEDIRRTNWSNVNTALSLSRGPFAAGASEAEWMDEGWKCSPITIQVPFHRLTENPGSHPYLVGQLHHRSLVAIIKERLKSADAGTRFHFEPHELLWRRGNGLKDVQVYGEMYTSDKLLEMHRNLLDSPPVPGCNAPRAILPLMFWSDSTHLTSFGQAKLWPLYMFFGSDSKYQRCKPSANLCSHMAYFQKVSIGFHFLCQD
jgi:hypothetical protein